MIADKRLLTGVAKADKENTVELESFHSLLNRNAPKMTPFSYSGMLWPYFFQIHREIIDLGVTSVKAVLMSFILHNRFFVCCLFSNLLPHIFFPIYFKLFVI